MAIFATVITFWGLSPRGRGNLSGAGLDRLDSGAIPARAGEPVVPAQVITTTRGYPRAGGGTGGSAALDISVKGLSPRGRGNLEDILDEGEIDGAIPARAGEPVATRDAAEPYRGYPRAGGGTSRCRTSTTPTSGLSPRGRGNHGRLKVDTRWSGAIPARAGEPPWPDSSTARSWGYPRAGGGTLQTIAREGLQAGLSPRGRGNRVRLLPGLRGVGAIPARAGEPAPR